MKRLNPTNAQLKQWASLEQAKGRQAENLFLAEGSKVVAELLKSTWPVRALLILEERADHFREATAALSGKAEIYGLTERQWRQVSQDKSPEGIMAVAAVPPMPAAGQLTEAPFMLMLHEINNPNNLGALLRAADWFGFRTVFLSRGTADFTNPKTVRTAMGSLFRLQVVAGLDFTEYMPVLRRGCRLIGSDVRKGVAPHACAGRTALLLGNESHGLPESLLAMTDERWHIPGAGGAESLSLPQAAAIMMYACVAELQP